MSMTTYRLLTDEAAATMHPDDAAERDAQMFAEAIGDAYIVAAELAVFKPLLAARLLTAYLVAEQPGQEEESERTWNHLIAAWRRTILAGTPPLHAAVPLVCPHRGRCVCPLKKESSRV